MPDISTQCPCSALYRASFTHLKNVLLSNFFNSPGNFASLCAEWEASWVIQFFHFTLTILVHKSGACAYTQHFYPMLALSAYNQQLFALPALSAFYPTKAPSTNWSVFSSRRWRWWSGLKRRSLVRTIIVRILSRKPSTILRWLSDSSTLGTQTNISLIFKQFSDEGATKPCQRTIASEKSALQTCLQHSSKATWGAVLNFPFHFGNIGAPELKKRDAWSCPLPDHVSDAPIHQRSLYHCPMLVPLPVAEVNSGAWYMRRALKLYTGVG